MVGKRALTTGSTRQASARCRRAWPSLDRGSSRRTVSLDSMPATTLLSMLVRPPACSRPLDCMQLSPTGRAPRPVCLGAARRGTTPSAWSCSRQASVLASAGGLIVRGADGGPVSREFLDAVEQHISLEPPVDSGSFQTANFIGPYLDDDLITLVDGPSIAAAGLNVVVDPMYGAGASVLALRSSVWAAT